MLNHRVYVKSNYHLTLRCQSVCCVSLSFKKINTFASFLNMMNFRMKTGIAWSIRRSAIWFTQRNLFANNSNNNSNSNRNHWYWRSFQNGKKYKSCNIKGSEEISTECIGFYLLLFTLSGRCRFSQTHFKFVRTRNSSKAKTI